MHFQGMPPDKWIKWSIMGENAADEWRNFCATAARLGDVNVKWTPYMFEVARLKNAKIAERLAELRSMLEVNRQREVAAPSPRVHEHDGASHDRRRG
jgi:hypothetical protein